MVYYYPDKDDRITAEMIQTTSHVDYWKASEDQVLALALAAVRKLPHVHRMLDLGCGMGRLFHLFAPLTDELLALEPDPGRYEAAKNSAAMLPGNKITVMNADSSMLKEEDWFDVILSSHVFQHIPPDLCESMVDDIRRHIRSGGLVILTTTHTDQDQDVYTIERMIQNRRQSLDVGKEEFLSFFSQKDVLPVRLFTENTIINMFHQSGFELICRRRFHYDGAVSVEYDNLANEEVYGLEGCVSEKPLQNPVLYTARVRDAFYLFRRKN